MTGKQWYFYPVTREIVKAPPPVERFRYLIYAEGGVNTVVAVPYGPPVYTVDYGDGYIESHTLESGDWAEHVYAQTGEYVVTLSGYSSPTNSFTAGSPGALYDWFGLSMPSCVETIDPLPYFGPSARYGHRFAILRKLTSGLFLNNVNAEDIAFFFSAYLSELKQLPEGLFEGCSNLKNIEFCFERTGITEIPIGLLAPCVNLEKTNFTFSECRSLTSIPDILATNSKIKDVTCMFNECSGATGNAPDWWNTHPNVNSVGCFRGCTGLSNYNEIPDNWK